MHINPGLLDCEDTTPLLHPLLGTARSLGGNVWKHLTGCPHFGQSVGRDFWETLFYSILVILTVVESRSALDQNTSWVIVGYPR